jgi:hypothetical protein
MAAGLRQSIGARPGDSYRAASGLTMGAVR